MSKRAASPAVSLRGIVAALAVLAACAPAPVRQAPAPASAPAPAPAPAAAAPAWQQGRPAAMAHSTLAPLPGRSTVTPPSEIPLDRLKLPVGFSIELWAHGIPGARAMARADGGKIYVGTRGIGRVYEVTDIGSTRTSRVVVGGLNQPAGVATHGGALVVMAIDQVLRFDGIAANPTVVPVDMTAAFDLPPLQHHNWKYIAFGPDGKLYVPFGAPCNICDPGTEYAQIRRYNADGSGMEVLARGVRNTVGFDFHPLTRELWFTDHGRDWMGEETPHDELNRLSAKGQHFGFPYCHEMGLPDPDLKNPDPCAGVTMPVAQMGAHSAVMGLTFYTGSMFPPEYRNTMFVMRKGSWNRTKRIGFDVLVVRADADGRNVSMVPFITGFHDAAAGTFWGRPAYALQMPDGALLISDEQVGAIYRVSYGR